MMKKISKFFAVILAVVMAVSALPISVSAQNVTLTITSDKSDVKAGDTVTVDVILSENSNLNALTFDLVYDNTALKYASTGTSEILGGATVNPSYADNKIRFTEAAVESVTAGGTVLSVSFTVLSSKCSTASINIIEALDEDINDIAVSSSSAKVHSYGDWNTVKNPDCVTAGQKNKACNCGDVISASIDPLGHDYSTEYTVDKEAGCTEKGSKSQHCSRCGSKQNVTEIPATGHNYKGEITKVPTHTENGEKTFICGNCNDSYKETIEADGTHKHISEVTKEPTCTEKGILTYTCACGDNYTEEIPAKGHTEVTIPAVAPTCTNTGLTSGTKCSVCGEVLTEQTTVPAKGHTEVTISAVAPTCTTTGLTAGIKCSDCGAVVDAQEEVPATGHIATEDGYCETCEEKICDHNCHKSGIAGFFWKIANFFNKLFGSKQYCECGWAHY